VAVPAGAEPIRWEAGAAGWDREVGLAGNLDLDRVAAVDRATGRVGTTGPSSRWSTLGSDDPARPAVRPLRLAVSAHRTYAGASDGVHRLENGPPRWERVAAPIPELLASRDGSLMTVPDGASVFEPYLYGIDAAREVVVLDGQVWRPLLRGTPVEQLVILGLGRVDGLPRGMGIGITPRGTLGLRGNAPAAAGVYPFTVTVYDSAGAHRVVPLELHVWSRRYADVAACVFRRYFLTGGGTRDVVPSVR